MEKLPYKGMELNKFDLQPGKRVSSEHYESNLIGRIYHSRGNTNAKDIYSGVAFLTTMQVVCQLAFKKWNQLVKNSYLRGMPRNMVWCKILVTHTM